MSDDRTERLIEHIEESLGEQGQWIPYPGGWPGQIELALLDAVFSGNATYGSPAAEGRSPTGGYKVVANWRDLRGVERPDSIKAMVALAERIGPENLPDQLDNRQFVPSGGLRKGVAAYEAARRMGAAGIESAQDLDDQAARVAAYDAYTSVRGLGWVTFDYLLSLLGHPKVKSDRMLVRFVGDALDSEAEVSAKEAGALVEAASDRLGVDRRDLDHAIWAYQRRR